MNSSDVGRKVGATGIPYIDTVVSGGKQRQAYHLSTNKKHVTRSVLGKQQICNMAGRDAQRLTGRFCFMC